MADPGLDPVGHTGESAEVARVDPAAPFVTVEELLRARLGAAFGGWRGALELVTRHTPAGRSPQAGGDLSAGCMPPG